MFYSRNPEADRAFFRDVLEFRAIDIGRGWMIFALPPAEAAVHPGDGQFSETHAGHQMMGALVYLMCDDLDTTMDELAAKGATLTAVTEARWGRLTSLRLPGGGEVGLYEPRHPRATDL